MSCNPAIGGVAKGQIVREIDALGGVMGRAIDATGIQFRMLNRRKGPAMHSPRAQADKKVYQFAVKRLVEEQPNLTLRQEVVEDLLIERSQTSESRSCRAIRMSLDLRIAASPASASAATPSTAPAAVVLTTGTFLQALMHTGEAKTPGGRAGEGTTDRHQRQPCAGWAFALARFKTGTPLPAQRPHHRLRPVPKLQPGDDDPRPFSFLTDRIAQSTSCPATSRTPTRRVHELIRANLHRAPMYSGQIQSRGPRYCPSIEDKVVRFADKDAAPDLPRAGRPQHARVLLQRHLAPACRATCRTRCCG